MTLTRSDIAASAADLEQFQRGLQQLSVSALWANQASTSRRPADR